MNTEAILVVRSATHAAKGRKILVSSSIGSRVVKPGSAGSSREYDGGCVYGIAVNKAQLTHASELLEKNGIEIREILHV